MRADEQRRLAVVETQVSEVREDVREIKADVKLLLASMNQGGGATSFLKSAVPWLALVVSAAVLFGFEVHAV